MSSMNVSAANAGNTEFEFNTRYLDTIAAYDQWSGIYDTDGNFLQALDTIEMESLLPLMLSKVNSDCPWKIVDLGCGTGRNTCKLLDIADTTIVGLEASPKMLDIARSKLSEHISFRDNASGRPKKIALEIYNIVTDPTLPSCALDADAMISTLVLEHIPAPAFFQTLHQILKPRGIALVTNMHGEMGKLSQAGFIDPSTGDKIRPQSYSHRLEDVIAEAGKQNFEIVGEARERSVDAEMSERLGPRARKWIGVTVWFGLLLQKKS